MHIEFAPLQGYTTALYRQLHHAMWGGVACYYTPFVRIEKGEFRRKELIDIAPENNTNTPVVPQMLPGDAGELKRLVTLFRENGYSRADINMGCPFPPVALHGRGSGLLPHKEKVAEIMKAVSEEREVQFSVKMRLGWEDKNEWRDLIDILNDTSLTHITIHPRIGRQQYKGVVDMEAFEQFCELCKHPIIYNGDLNSMRDIENITTRFPQIKGIMLGRGLLARPYLSKLISSDVPYTAGEIIEQTEKFHNALYEELASTSQGNTQLLQRAHALWEYFLPHAPRKERKAVLKSSSPAQYSSAVARLFESWHAVSNEVEAL